MVQPNAVPNLTASSMALEFILGRVPGWARVMALTCVLGIPEKSAWSPQNNLLFVCNWACTSSPTTSSYFSVLLTQQKYRKE